jgi:hypothetical protein
MNLSFGTKCARNPASIASGSWRLFGLVCIITGLWWLMAPLFSAATPQKPSTSDPVQLSGTLGKNLKIEMRLWKNGNKLSGTYVYTHIGKDIRVEGNVDEKGGFRLEESFDGRNTGFFSGQFLPGDRMEGEWSKPDGSGKRPFQLAGAAPFVRKGEPATAGPVKAANPRVSRPPATVEKPVPAKPAPVQAVSAVLSPKPAAPPEKSVSPTATAAPPTRATIPSAAPVLPAAMAQPPPQPAVVDDQRTLPPPAPAAAAAVPVVSPGQQASPATVSRAPALVASHHPGTYRPATGAEGCDRMPSAGPQGGETATAAGTKTPTSLEGLHAEPLDTGPAVMNDASTPSGGPKGKPPSLIRSVLWNGYSAAMGLLLVVVGMMAVIGLGDREMAVRKYRDAVPIFVISLCMGALLLILIVS